MRRAAGILPAFVSACSVRSGSPISRAACLALTLISSPRSLTTVVSVTSRTFALRHNSIAVSASVAAASASIHRPCVQPARTASTQRFPAFSPLVGPASWDFFGASAVSFTHLWHSASVKVMRQHGHACASLAMVHHRFFMRLVIRCRQFIDIADGAYRIARDRHAPGLSRHRGEADMPSADVKE